jgi:hypothetical protein
VLLTIADAGGGAFAYVADYTGMQPVSQTDGSGHLARGVERGTLTPAGGQLDREADDGGLTTIVTDAGGGSHTLTGTSGLHPTPPVTYTCTGATLRFVYVGSQEADNYRRG